MTYLHCHKLANSIAIAIHVVFGALISNVGLQQERGIGFEGAQRHRAACRALTRDSCRLGVAGDQQTDGGAHPGAVHCLPCFRVPCLCQSEAYPKHH